MSCFCSAAYSSASKHRVSLSSNLASSHAPMEIAYFHQLKSAGRFLRVFKDL